MRSEHRVERAAYGAVALSATGAAGSVRRAAGSTAMRRTPGRAAVRPATTMRRCRALCDRAALPPGVAHRSGRARGTGRARPRQSYDARPGVARSRPAATGPSTHERPRCVRRGGRGDAPVRRDARSSRRATRSTDRDARLSARADAFASSAAGASPSWRATSGTHPPDATSGSQECRLNCRVGSSRLPRRRKLRSTALANDAAPAPAALLDDRDRRVHRGMRRHRGRAAAAGRARGGECRARTVGVRSSSGRREDRQRPVEPSAPRPGPVDEKA